MSATKEFTTRASSTLYFKDMESKFAELEFKLHINLELENGKVAF